MYRVVLSIVLVVAFFGASAASVMHGLDGGSDHADHHAEMAMGDPMIDAEQTLSECCDATGGMGAASCFGDFIASAGISQMTAIGSMKNGLASDDIVFSDLTPAVPTGPPKA